MIVYLLYKVIYYYWARATLFGCHQLNMPVQRMLFVLKSLMHILLVLDVGPYSVRIWIYSNESIQREIMFMQQMAERNTRRHTHARISNALFLWTSIWSCGNGWSNSISNNNGQPNWKKKSIECEYICIYIELYLFSIACDSRMGSDWNDDQERTVNSFCENEHWMMYQLIFSLIHTRIIFIHTFTAVHAIPYEMWLSLPDEIPTSTVELDINYSMTSELHFVFYIF